MKQGRIVNLSKSEFRTTVVRSHLLMVLQENRRECALRTILKQVLKRVKVEWGLIYDQDNDDRIVRMGTLIQYYSS